MRSQTIPLTLLAISMASSNARTPIAGDFDGDGIGDAAFYDKASATLEVGYDIAAPAPEWHTYDLRRHHYFDGQFLRAADLNSDNRIDLYVADRAANRVLVLWGNADRQTGFVVEPFSPGPGPSFADLVPATATLAVPLMGSSAPTWHRFLPENPNQKPIAIPFGGQYASHIWTDFRAGRETLSNVAINPAAFAAARSRTSGMVIVFQKRNIGSLSRSTEAVNSSLDRLTAFGFFEGGTKAPATVAFGAGADEIEVLRVTAGAGSNSPVLNSTVHNVGPLADAHTISTAGGDRLLLVDAAGQSARIYEIDGGQLVLDETLAPPPGGRFLSLAQDADGKLVASLLGGQGFAVYADAGGGYVLQQSGAVPLPPMPESGTQLVLFDHHPYGAEPALPLEHLPAGDWASAPSLAGMTIGATLESLLDPLVGLGNPTPISLDAGVALPEKATVFANQVSVDTSISFSDGPGADGSAAVLVSPPGGSFASTIELSFLAAGGTTVHYRLGDGTWQSTAAAGMVTIEQNTVFEYYGANAAALSAIRTEEYIITQDPNADADGDKVPDAIEREFGLSPLGGGDSDGDGHSDFSEIVNGSNPADPTDHPAEELKLDTVRLKVSIEGVRADGVTAPPALGTEVFVRTLDGGLLAAATTGQVAAPQVSFEVESPPQLVVVETIDVFPLSGFFFQFWPHGRRLSAVVELPPRGIPEGTVDPASNDIVGDWLAEVNASIAAIQSEVVNVLLDPTSTLAGIAFEAWPSKWKGFSLNGKGTEVIDEPRPGVITLLAEEVIDAIEAVEEDGDRFNLIEVRRLLNAALADPANAALLAAVRDVYATSAGTNPDNGAAPTPIRALREFSHDGTVLPEYSGDLTPPLVLGNLWNTVVDSPMADAVVNANGLLETTGTDCLVLVEPGLPPTRYELVDSAGLPYWQTENAPILAGAAADLTGFVLPNAAPSCGDVVVEVISLEVTGVPPEPIDDFDDDGLPDGLESLLFGLFDGGFWDDPDGDGYTTGAELFLDPLNPTDPTDNNSFPAGPPAIPANQELADGGANFTLEWDGNSAATYSVECAFGLQGWIASPIPPDEDPPGHFSWSDPNPIEDELRKFYRIVVELQP